MSYTLTQKVMFENTTTDKLYSMYLNPKHHSAITGGKHAEISDVEGAKYNANGGGHFGKILQLIKNRLIVQSFYAADWEKGEIDSTLILYFEQKGSDVIMHVTHANIPDRQANAIDMGWKEIYWTPWKEYLTKLKQNAEPSL